MAVQVLDYGNPNPTQILAGGLAPLQQAVANAAQGNVDFAKLVYVNAMRELNSQREDARREAAAKSVLEFRDKLDKASDELKRTQVTQDSLATSIAAARAYDPNFNVKPGETAQETIARSALLVKDKESEKEAERGIKLEREKQAQSIITNAQQYGFKPGGKTEEDVPNAIKHMGDIDKNDLSSLVQRASSHVNSAGQGLNQAEIKSLFELAAMDAGVNSADPRVSAGLMPLWTDDDIATGKKEQFESSLQLRAGSVLQERLARMRNDDVASSLYRDISKKMESPYLRGRLNEVFTANGVAPGGTTQAGPQGNNNPYATIIGAPTSPDSGAPASDPQAVVAPAAVAKSSASPTGGSSDYFTVLSPFKAAGSAIGDWMTSPDQFDGVGTFADNALSLLAAPFAPKAVTEKLQDDVQLARINRERRASTPSAFFAPVQYGRNVERPMFTDIEAARKARDARVASERAAATQPTAVIAPQSPAPQAQQVAMTDVDALLASRGLRRASYSFGGGAEPGAQQVRVAPGYGPGSWEWVVPKSSVPQVQQPDAPQALVPVQIPVRGGLSQEEAEAVAILNPQRRTLPQDSFATPTMRAPVAKPTAFQMPTNQLYPVMKFPQTPAAAKPPGSPRSQLPYWAAVRLNSAGLNEDELSWLDNNLGATGLSPESIERASEPELQQLASKVRSLIGYQHYQNARQVIGLQ